MKYVNILLIGLVLLFPGCTFLDVVPEGNIESIESNFEKRGPNGELVQVLSFLGQSVYHFRNFESGLYGDG